MARTGTQWHTVARAGVIGTIKCKKVKLPRQWRTVARGGVIGTIKCKKVKLLGSGARWGDWDN